MYKIALWDPSGDIPEGSLVEGERGIERLHERGVIMLPADPVLLQQSPVGGMFSRKWGEGVPFTRMRPMRGCAMMLFVTPEIERIHWVARLIPDDADQIRSGVLRLIGHTAAPGHMSGGMSAISDAIDLSKLAAVDDHGGWTVYGATRISATTEGFLAFVLHGACTGVRVVLSGVSAVRAR